MSFPRDTEGEMHGGTRGPLGVIAHFRHVLDRWNQGQRLASIPSASIPSASGLSLQTGDHPSSGLRCPIESTSGRLRSMLIFQTIRSGLPGGSPFAFPRWLLVSYTSHWGRLVKRPRRRVIFRFDTPCR